MSMSLADGLGLFTAIKDLFGAQVANVPGPAVGSPYGPQRINLPNGTQDVVDYTLYVEPLPIVGDPTQEPEPFSDAEINLIFGQAATSRDELGGLDYAGGFRSVFGGPQMQQLRQQHPDLLGYGGPLDAVANFFTSASEKTLGALGSATKGAVSALNKAIATTNTKLSTLERNQKNMNSNFAKRIGALEQTVRQVSDKWNQSNGSQTMYKRLVLTVAQSWPGIKANRTIHDPSLVSFFAIQKRFFAAIEAKITLSDTTTITAAPVAYSQGDLNAILVQIRANLDDMRGDIAALAAVHNELAGGVLADEASKKSASVFHSYISNRSMLDQIAEIMPSQLTDQTQAMWEGGIKYIGPKPSAAGTGIFGGLGL